jgi:hypothetical protein
LPAVSLQVSERKISEIGRRFEEDIGNAGGQAASQTAGDPRGAHYSERDSFFDSLLVRIHFIIVMIR